MRRRNSCGPRVGGGSLEGVLPTHPAFLGRDVPPFLCTPSSPLLSSHSALLRRLFLCDLPSSLLHKRTLKFGLFPDSLTLSPTGNSSPERTTSPFLTSLSLLQLWVLLLSLQGSSPSTSPVPFQDAHLLGLSLQGLSLPVPSVPSRTLLFPGCLLSPAGLSLACPSSPLWDSRRPVPPAPSSPPLLRHS